MQKRKRSANGKESDGRKSVGRPRAVPAPRSYTPTWLVIFGANLRRTRKRQQLSVEQLADKTKNQPDFVKRVENGEAPELDLIAVQSFATALDVEYTDLTKGCDRPGGV